MEARKRAARCGGKFAILLSMIVLLVIVGVAVLGWTYVLCRAVNRVSTMADRLVRLSQVGYGVLISAPVVYVGLVWWLREFAGGWWGIKAGELAERGWVWCGLWGGVGVVAVELIRRPIELAVRKRRVGGAVTLVEHRVERDASVYAEGRGLMSKVARVLSHVPGNHIAELHVERYRVRLGQGAAGKRVRLVHISDLHYTRWLPEAVGEQVVRAVNDLEADIIAITGDFINARACVERVCKFVARLRARAGVYYVCGNHDIWEGDEELRAGLDSVGCVHIAGRVEAVDVGAAKIYVAGTERPWRRDRLMEQLSMVAARGCCVVLSHHPDNILWLRRARPALVVSGHTHGGQVALPGLGPLLVPSVRGSAHAAGFIRYGETLLFINYGLGVGFPVRLFCPPEIACLELEFTDKGE